MRVLTLPGVKPLRRAKPAGVRSVHGAPERDGVQQSHLHDLVNVPGLPKRPGRPHVAP